MTYVLRIYYEGNVFNSQAMVLTEYTRLKAEIERMLLQNSKAFLTIMGESGEPVILPFTVCNRCVFQFEQVG